MSTVFCPQCQQPYPFRTELVGKKVRCQKCQQVFEFPSGEPLAGAVQPLYSAPPGLFGAPLPPPNGLVAGPGNYPSLGDQASPGMGPPSGYSPLPATAANFGPASAATGVPGQFGQVVRQYPFGPRARAVSIIVPLVLVFCLGISALLATGAADRVTYRKLPVRHVFYVLLPALVLLSSGLAGLLVYSRVYPAQVSLTTLGIYFPKSSFNRTMVFIPFHDRPAMHVDEVAFVFFTTADLRLSGPHGKYSISKAMLPSDQDFYELVELLKARLPFV